MKTRRLLAAAGLALVAALAGGCATTGEIEVQKSHIAAQERVALAKIEADKAVQLAFAAAAPANAAGGFMSAWHAPPAAPAPQIVVPQVESAAGRWAQLLAPTLGFAGQVVGAVYQSRSAMRQSDNATAASIAATAAQRDATVASYAANTAQAQAFATSSGRAFETLGAIAARPTTVVTPQPNIISSYNLGAGAMGNFGAGNFVGPVNTITTTTRTCTGGNGAQSGNSGTTGSPAAGGPGGTANC